MNIPERAAIVVVDDNPEFGPMLKRLLRHIAPGHTVYSCTDGDDALDYIAHHPVCCIITDYNMNHMDGLVLAQTITIQWPAVSIILLTGILNASIQAAAKVAGCLIVLEKPVSVETLRAVILPLLSAIPAP